MPPVAQERTIERPITARTDAKSVEATDRSAGRIFAAPAFFHAPDPPYFLSVDTR
jgi:hypothetical protein